MSVPHGTDWPKGAGGTDPCLYTGIKWYLALDYISWARYYLAVEYLYWSNWNTGAALMYDNRKYVYAELTPSGSKQKKE